MPKSKKRSSRRRASPWQGTVRLGLVFAGLIAVNVYFFFLRGGTSVRALLRTTELGKQGGAAAAIKGAGELDAANAAHAHAAGGAAQKKATAADDDDARVVEGAMKDDDTVERAWKRDGLGARDVNELATALGRVFDLRTVREGQSYQLRFSRHGCTRVSPGR